MTLMALRADQKNKFGGGSLEGGGGISGAARPHELYGSGIQSRISISSDRSMSRRFALLSLPDRIPVLRIDRGVKAQQHLWTSSSAIDRVWCLQTRAAGASYISKEPQ